MTMTHSRLAYCCAFLLALTAVSPSFAATKAAPAAQVTHKATTPIAPVKAVAQKSATEVVKNFYAQLQATMKQGDQLGFSGRYKKLEPVLQQSFNFPLMTRFAVGLVWNDATPEEQKQITSAFSQFSVATYASRFPNYDGEEFKVIGEKPNADGKIVETTLKPKDGEAVALNYLLRQDESGAWRICDVFLNGSISELATRRSEFSSVIKRDGIAELVNSLSTKSKKMGAS